MSDELDPVEQRFIADLADYVEPIQGAADDTEEFAAAVREAKDSLDGIRDAAGEAAGSISDLAGSEDELAGSIAAADHELHDQTESFFALAAAADAAAASEDHFRDSMGRQDADARGLYATLQRLRDLLADSELGEQFTIGNAGPSGFALITPEDEQKLGWLGSEMNKAEMSISDADRAAKALGLSLKDTDNIARDARKAFEDLGFSEIHAAGAARSLEKAQKDLKALLDVGKGGGGIGGFLSTVFGSGGLGKSVGVPGPLPDMPIFAILGLLPAVAGAIGAIVTAVNVLVSGFGAAILGVGSFALFAVPELRKVIEVLSGTNTKSSLHGASLQMYDDIEKIIKEYDKIEKAVAPDVMRVFNQVVRNTGPVLRDLALFAKAAAGPLDELAVSFGKTVNSKGFQEAIQTISKYIGPSISAIGGGIGVVFKSIFGFLTALSPKDVGQGIRGFFQMIADGINALTWVVKASATTWDWLTQKAVPAIEHAFENFKHAFDNVSHAYGNFAHAMDNTSHAFENLIHAGGNVRHAFDDMNNWIRRVFTTDIPNWIRDGASAVNNLISSLLTWVVTHWDSGWSQVVAFAKRVPGDILHAFAGLGSLLVAAGESLIRGLISGIENEIPGLRGAVSIVEGLLHDIGIGGGGGGVVQSRGNITGGLGHTILGGAGSGGGGTVHHSVSVSVAAMAGPAYQQGLQQAVHSAVLDFAQANGTSMLLLPGRRS